MTSPAESITQTTNSEKHTHGLYYVIPAAIMDSEDLNPMTKLLYALLSGLAYEDGKCFPSDKYLSERLHLAPRQVKLYILKLEQVGLISRETHPCSANPFKKVRTITVHSSFPKHLSEGAEKRPSGVRKSALRVSEANIVSEEITTPTPSKGESETVSFLPYVKLKKIEYECFVTQVGKQKIDAVIAEMNDYLEATGKKPYRNFAAAIRNWLRRRENQPHSTSGMGFQIQQKDKKQRDKDGNDLNVDLNGVF